MNPHAPKEVAKKSFHTYEKKPFTKPSSNRWTDIHMEQKKLTKCLREIVQAISPSCLGLVYLYSCK